jgi:hypothetical protein
MGVKKTICHEMGKKFIFRRGGINIIFGPKYTVAPWMVGVPDRTLPIDHISAFYLSFLNIHFSHV